jgi:4-hydroxybenzoate polyprenyltransferase
MGEPAELERPACAVAGSAADGAPTSSARRGLSGWLELARAGNLPTILSNALVGWAIGGAAPLDRRFGFALLAVALLYTAGMIFNDVCDLGVDRRERPRRPLPSGRVSVRAATVVVGVLLLLAMISLALTSGAAVAAGGILAAMIVAYDLLHVRFASTVILMAACRAMVYIVVASAVPPPGGWPLPAPLAPLLAGTLGVYVVGLSLVARLEMAPERSGSAAVRAAPLALAVVPFLGLAATGLPRSGSRVWAMAAAALMVLWILRGVRHAQATPARRPAAVGVWISAIPLVDAFFLTLLDRPALALAAALCWPATVLLQRRLAAT